MHTNTTNEVCRRKQSLTEGVILSGARIRAGTMNGCGSGEAQKRVPKVQGGEALEKPPSGGAEGARRNSCVNLSGKRTECKKRSSGQFGGRVSPGRRAVLVLFGSSGPECCICIPALLLSRTSFV